MYCFQIANAGVNEVGNFSTPKIKNGKPEKPPITTVDVNLLGSIYSKDNRINRVYAVFVSSACSPAAHLAIHYLELERKLEDTLKSLVLIGSMGKFPSTSAAWTLSLT